MEELDDILKDEGKHHSFSEAEGDIQEAGDRTDLNKYIEEILENQDTLHQSYTIATTKNQMKCNPPFLSGTLMKKGLSSNARQRACDSLHCTDCDSPIISVEDSIWSSKVDYYFLRTNYPNMDKLKLKLKHKKGSRAYCCQCKSITAAKAIRLDERVELRWICRKHNDSVL
ncbi:unnamed protein product [Calicophoron daubneyi]|uniref:Cilia- and flagella-associated protein 418 n=1 Tax=Calicophoron daubneyi TaxID=300641 RepID=A0AAV2T5V7_CALDB